MNIHTTFEFSFRKQIQKILCRFIRWFYCSSANMLIYDGFGFFCRFIDVNMGWTSFFLINELQLVVVKKSNHVLCQSSNNVITQNTCLIIILISYDKILNLGSTSNRTKFEIIPKKHFFSSFLIHLSGICQSSNVKIHPFMYICTGCN